MKIAADSRSKSAALSLMGATSLGLPLALAGVVVPLLDRVRLTVDRSEPYEPAGR